MYTGIPETLTNTTLVIRCVRVIYPIWSDRPCVAQWLERPLGAREAGVRSPTASHQRRKNWEVCAYQIGAGH